MSHSFPKIIWQTHNYKRDTLPTNISAAAATWKNLNPEWDYRYVDNEQRDETVRAYPEIYKTYKDQKPGFQSDIWRFIVTYNYGGCYADMDSVCVKPLDYLLQDIDSSIEMVTVPVKDGYGNTHNYVTKQKSKPMTKVFNQMIQYPQTLIGWQTWSIFTENVYSDETVSKLFVVQTQNNSWEDQAARHMEDYKIRFEPSEHKINNYGQMMNYLEFINQNSLKATL
jgi:mannosyltransferase OCH1-like enzyme